MTELSQSQKLQKIIERAVENGWMKYSVNATSKINNKSKPMIAVEEVDNEQ